ncbi:hypothetical protein B0H13DRAFT_2319483 [Mycena leptocephala]|nr:hypothetical protein B0H13DRAFT_2319483 [Mycena leptocephala]
MSVGPTQSIQDIRQKKTRRIMKIMQERAVVGAARNSQTPNASTPPVTEGAMDVAGSAGAGHNALLAHDEPAEMEVDNRIVPLPLQPSFPDLGAACLGSKSVERANQGWLDSCQFLELIESPEKLPVHPDHGPAAPKWERRRSYDDVEVYDLQYTGPPIMVDRQEAAVEALAGSATDDSPPPRDMSALSELETDDEPSSSVASSERDFASLCHPVVNRV